MEKISINYKNKRKYIHFTYRVNSVFKNQVTFRHCTESQVTYNLKHCTLPVLHCDLLTSTNYLPLPQYFLFPPQRTLSASHEGKGEIVCFQTESLQFQM